MKFAKLGRTGVTVSKIALGTATLGVAPSVETADAVIHRAIDLGINVFDCANSYGNQPRFDRPGAAPPATERASAEEILGKTLGARRKEVMTSFTVAKTVHPRNRVEIQPRQRDDVRPLVLASRAGDGPGGAVLAQLGTPHAGDLIEP